MRRDKLANKYNNVLRFNPSFSTGLDKEQVKQRRKEKLTNRYHVYNQKSLKNILMNNIITVFNLILIFVSTLLIISGRLNNIYFFIVSVVSILIGVIFDIHVRIVLSKGKYHQKYSVIRDGQEIVIKSSQIVLDDIVLLKEGDTLNFDGEIMNGSLILDESLITGNKQSKRKLVGDKIYSAERVVAGQASVKVIDVGSYTSESKFASQLKSVKSKTSELTKLLTRVSIFVGILLLTLFILSLFSLGKTIDVFDFDAFKNSSSLLALQLFNITPYALYFLINIALIFSLISLRRIQTQVLDFYALNTLSKIDVVLFDKTGTISNRELEVFKTIPFGNRSNQDIAQIISNVLYATEDHSVIGSALSQTYTYELSNLINSVVHFNPDNNYFGASFKGGKTYLIADMDSINLINKTATMSHANEYLILGYKVLVIVESNGKIIDNKLIGEASAIGIIVLKEKIKNNAIEVIKYLKEQKIDVRVISGDNPFIASEIARQAEIDNSDKYISLKDKMPEEIEMLFENFAVFGDVSAEQKKLLVEEFQKQGKRVLVIGDGLNDCLALKQADCSIAMGDGCLEAKNVSKVVLQDSNLLSIPALIAKAKRTTNNVKRIISINLLKPIFVSFFAILYTMFNLVGLNTVTDYPFMDNSLLFFDLIILLASIFFVFDFNREKVNGSLTSSVIKNVSIGSVLIIAGIGLTLLLKEFNKNDIFYANISDDVISDGVVTASAINSMVQIVLLILIVIVFIRLSTPSNKYRIITMVSLPVFAILLVGIYALLYYLNNTANEFNLYFGELNLANYFEMAVIALCLSTTYLSITQIFISFKKEKNKC